MYMRYTCGLQNTSLSDRKVTGVKNLQRWENDLIGDET